MVRASRHVVDDLRADWVAIGHSHGGHATLFTASFATRYAHELRYRGAVALAPASGDASSGDR